METAVTDKTDKTDQHQKQEKLLVASIKSFGTVADDPEIKKMLDDLIEGVVEQEQKEGIAIETHSVPPTPSAPRSILPHEWGCLMVFRFRVEQLVDSVKFEQVDPVWKESPKNICDAVKTIICNDFGRFIPELNLKPGENVLEKRASLLELEGASDSTSIYDIPERLKEPRSYSSYERIVGLSGKKQSGKSTVADHLVHHHNFIEMPFAGSLKEFCCRVFLFSDQQVYDPVLKETVDPRWGTSPRKILQYVGTEVFRTSLLRKLPNLDVGPYGIWEKSADIYIREFMHPHFTRLIFSDVRFQDEIDYINSLQGTLIKIVREDPQKTTHTSETTQTTQHASETSLDSVVFANVVQNNNTLDHLYRQVLQFLKF